MKHTCTQTPAVSVKSTQTERKTCGRCGGDGRYPSSCYNGVCLGCNGLGYRLTKRGQLADEYLKNLRSLPVEQLQAGMLIRAEYGMAGQIRTFATIVKIERITLENARCTWEDPVTKQRTGGNGFNVELSHPKYGAMHTSIDAGKLVRVGQTAEQKAATLAQALAFQDTLTKAGTVRKS